MLGDKIGIILRIKIIIYNFKSIKNYSFEKGIYHLKIWSNDVQIIHLLNSLWMKLQKKTYEYQLLVAIFKIKRFQ